MIITHNWDGEAENYRADCRETGRNGVRGTGDDIRRVMGENLTIN